MSNATTLQTNNNKLSANNTDLASILNTINNLPEAGGSGGSGGLTVFSVPYTGPETSFMLNHGALPLGNDVSYKVTATNSNNENFIEETMSFSYAWSDGGFDVYRAETDNVLIVIFANLSDGGAISGSEMFIDGFSITLSSNEATSVTFLKL